MFFQITGPISLAVGSTLSQYLLINIRIQASLQERMETDFSFEGIQFQSGPGSDKSVHNESFGSIRSMTATADWKGQTYHSNTDPGILLVSTPVLSRFVCPFVSNTLRHTFFYNMFVALVLFSFHMDFFLFSHIFFRLRFVHVYAS